MRARDDVGAADQHRTREALVDGGLRGAQHALVLAFRVGDALRRALGRGEHRLHRRARFVHEAAQSWSRYSSKSLIGRVATPLSIAAFATAGAMLVMRRGSNARGMR